MNPATSPFRSAEKETNLCKTLMRLVRYKGVADSIGHASDSLAEGCPRATSTHRKIEIVGVGVSEDLTFIKSMVWRWALGW